MSRRCAAALLQTWLKDVCSLCCLREKISVVWSWWRSLHNSDKNSLMWYPFGGKPKSWNISMKIEKKSVSALFLLFSDWDWVWVESFYIFDCSSLCWAVVLLCVVSRLASTSAAACCCTLYFFLSQQRSESKMMMKTQRENVYSWKCEWSESIARVKKIGRGNWTLRGFFGRLMSERCEISFATFPFSTLLTPQRYKYSCFFSLLLSTSLNKIRLCCRWMI